jgi:hypothetical protein
MYINQFPLNRSTLKTDNFGYHEYEIYNKAHSKEEHLGGEFSF